MELTSQKACLLLQDIRCDVAMYAMQKTVRIVALSDAQGAARTLLLRKRNEWRPVVSGASVVTDRVRTGGQCTSGHFHASNQISQSVGKKVGPDLIAGFGRPACVELLDRIRGCIV